MKLEPRTLDMKHCPICGESSVYRFEMRQIPILRCTLCHHGFADYGVDEQHLATVYGDDYFSGGGPGYENYLSEAELLQRQGRRYGMLISQYAPRARVLDVGCAAGFIAAGMRDAGLAVCGLEPNERMATYASSSLGISTYQGSLEDLDAVGVYDAVSMIQVVAHFIDPRRAFASAARVTTPNGYWLIEGWDSNGVVARLLGSRWHVYNPPSVLNYFTMKSLDLLAAEFGFGRLATGRPSKLITASHATSLLEFLAPRSKAFRFAASLANRVPDSFVLPYPGDDIFWAIYKRGALTS